MRDKPDMQIDIFFVPYGYQVDVKKDQSDNDHPKAGWLIATECRDFNGSYTINNLKADMTKHIFEMLDRFRKDK